MKRIASSLKLGLLAVAGLAALVSPASAASFRLQSYLIPTGFSQPIQIVLGPDGNMWFTEQNAGKVARVTPSGIVTEFTTPTVSFPHDIVAGPDGNVWFTEGAASNIARITPKGKIKEFTYTPFGVAAGITVGPDGQIWFTDITTNSVWRFDLATETFTSFPMPTANCFPGLIRTGSDGNMWYIFAQPGGIAKVTTAGVITELPQVLDLPGGLALGPDGNMWFTEIFVARVGKVTPDGVFTFYESGLHTLEGLAAGPDGNMWITSFGDDKIASVTMDGVVSPSPEIRSSQPTGIAPGNPRGGRKTLWFLGYGNDKVYQVQLP